MTTNKPEVKRYDMSAKLLNATDAAMQDSKE